MLNVKRRKRKRQTTLDDLFQRQRQRPLRSDGQGTSTMTDVNEVCSCEDDEANSRETNNTRQNEAQELAKEVLENPSETKQARGMTSEELADTIEDLFSTSQESVETQGQKDESFMMANMEVINRDGGMSSEATTMPEKVEEKSSKTNIETIVIESSQELTEDSIGECSCNADVEIPEEDQDKPFVVTMGTSNIVEDKAESSPASVVTQEEKCMPFVVTIGTSNVLEDKDESSPSNVDTQKEKDKTFATLSKTNNETIVVESSQETPEDSENLETQEEKGKTFAANMKTSGEDGLEDLKNEREKIQEWLSHESEEVQDRRNAKAQELVECLNSMAMERRNSKDKGEFSGARVETQTEEGDKAESSEASVEENEGRSFEAERETREEDKDKAGLSELQEGDGDVSIDAERESKNESDDETQNYELLSENSENTEEPVRLGVEFDTLLRAPGCCGPQQTLTPSQTHTISFRPYRPSQPYPRSYRDKWDREHVRMPCSQQNKYPAQVGERRLDSRWELICRAFIKPMATSYDLENAILSYNAYHGRNLNFRLLHMLLLEKISPEEHKEFLEFTLPGIIRMALSLPESCTQSLPFLKQQQEHTITMTQQQAACLLACAFLCMFPRRNAGVRRNQDDEYFSLPSMNFIRLFQLDDNNRRASIKKIEKLKCILHYFKRVLQQSPCGTISFKRQVLRPDETPKWHSCCTRLCRLRVSSQGTIEDDAQGLLQVDFANKLIGGGVLGGGCVQEEIRFAICPELIVSRLFTERLQDNECLIVTGAERFSDYVGYAGSFQWAGNHVDQTPRDSWGRRHTEVVAIDAKPHMLYPEQFSPANLKRELEKAFCGFLSRHSDPKHLPAVATGKWGCGAFGGDPQLKCIIQIMAASAAHRDVLYFTFDDKDHARELHEIHSLLKDRDITIGDLWRILNNFKKQLSSDTTLDIFGYIRQVLGPSDDDERCL